MRMFGYTNNLFCSIPVFSDTPHIVFAFVSTVTVTKSALTPLEICSLDIVLRLAQTKQNGSHAPALSFVAIDIPDGANCMRGTTGFTKVEKLFGNAIASSAVPLQDLQVGDRIVGLDATKSEVDDCEVVSVSNQGGATVYQNYTADHYVVSEDDANYLQQHGKGGLEEGEPTTVYQVLSSCPVVRDESGKLSSFSICGKVLYKGGPMPWSMYLKIHGIMFSIVKSTGVRDSSAFHDAAYATRHLPGLCVSGLDCAEHGNCTTFEAKMLAFANQELTAEAHAKVLAAFPEFGNASKEGSVSSVVSKGNSVVAAE